jgi:ABC-type xylose transport system permease subunit
MHIPSFVVTLATMLIVRGAAFRRNKSPFKY